MVDDLAADHELMERASRLDVFATRCAAVAEAIEAEDSAAGESWDDALHECCYSYLVAMRLIRRMFVRAIHLIRPLRRYRPALARRQREAMAERILTQYRETFEILGRK